MPMPSVTHGMMIAAAAPRRFWLYNKLRSRVGWNGERIRAYQEKKLRSLIRYCWKYVPFYRAHWKGSISGPEEIRTIEDLTRLPTLTKDEVREHLDALTSTASWVRKSAARTGGSTGRPVIFYMTNYDEQLAWAQIYLGWSWAGYRVGDPFLAVGGESIGVGLSDARSRKDRVMNRWVSSGSNLTLDRARELSRSEHFARIRLIYGYPN